MMSKDIHKWTRGRYTLMFDEHTFFVWDNEKDDRMTALETTERLNMQQATISQLKEINKEIGDDLYHCRLNKNIISEKLKLWQNTLAEYNIYTIKDLSLQMKILKEENEQLKQEIIVYKKAFQEQVQRCSL